MGDLPEDVVYSITTGFYPELFSGEPMWKRKKGKGRKGMQWVKQRGFHTAQVKKIAGKRIDKQGWGDFLTQLREGTSWKSAMGALKKDREKLGLGDAEEYASGIEERGRELGYVDDQGNFSQAKMEANINFYKFMGSSGQNYKLWGSKVWWQHGQRQKKHEMESALSDWSRDSPNRNVGAYLEGLYSKKEKDLWPLARKLAKQVFGQAIDKDNLRTDLESVGKEALVPEEERKEATRESSIKAEKPIDKSLKDWHKVSKARGLDIKLRMENGTTIYMDSTEMPIHQKNSHGIVEEVTEAMKVAIENAKETTDEDGPWKADLEAAVITMFEKSIRLYNVELNDMLAVSPKDKKGQEAIKALMKEITAERKSKKQGHGGDPRASVDAIARRIGGIFASNATEDAGLRAQRETALKYVVHMLVNLAGEANDNFRQGHLIGKMYGRNTYASVGMQLENRGIAPQFSESYMRDNTYILQGENHLIAFQESKKFIQAGVAKETQARQIQAFQQGKIIGKQATSGSSARASANMGLVRGCRPTTSVVFHPKAMGKMLDMIPDKIGKNVKDGEDRIRDKFQKVVERKRQHKILPKKMKQSKAKFWAMPYLGLMEYPQKAKEAIGPRQQHN